MPVLSVIIPAYNEATRVGRTIEQVLSYLHAQPFSSELIVVSDGSTDDTGWVGEGYFNTHPDTQCGFKAFRMAACRPIVEGAGLDRFGFNVELLCLTHRAGLRLLEQPVRWNDAADSKVGILDGLDGFRERQLLRRRARRGHYDEALRQACTLASQPGSTPDAAA